MFYKLIIYHLRIKMLRYFLAYITKGRMAKSKNPKDLKRMNLLSYGLELFSAYYFKPRKK